MTEHARSRSNSPVRHDLKKTIVYRLKKHGPHWRVIGKKTFLREHPLHIVDDIQFDGYSKHKTLSKLRTHLYKKYAAEEFYTLPFHYDLTAPGEIYQVFYVGMKHKNLINAKNLFAKYASTSIGRYLPEHTWADELDAEEYRRYCVEY